MFSSSSGSQQAQSGVSDLFLGAGGFSGALGNGFSNDSNAPSSAVANNPAGSGTAGSTNTLDLSDFPMLGGAAPGGSSASSVSSSGLAAALRQQQQQPQPQQSQQQQQQLRAHQQMLQSGTNQQNNLYRQAMSSGSNGGNFNMATEDFPALPGAPPAGSINTAAPTSSSLLIGGAGAISNNGGINSNQTGVNLGGVTSTSRTMNVGSSGLYGNETADGSNNNGNNTVGAQKDINALLGGAGLGGIGSNIGGGAGGAIGGVVGAGQVVGANGGLVSLSSLQHQPQSQQSASNQQKSLQSSRGSNTSTAPISNAAGGGGSGPAIGSALSGDYGLLGLLGVIRMTDADRNSLALGSDPTMLGLNLGTADQIYQTFSSPWAESTATKEPHFQLPSCYFMQPPALKTGHLSKFQLETLFYIFYAFPKDVLQAYAAQELYTREWRYHTDLKLWFKRAGPTDGVATSSGSTPQYLYFDINSWERRGFNGNMNQNFTSGFLSEDDVRVQFPSS